MTTPEPSDGTEPTRPITPAPPLPSSGPPQPSSYPGGPVYPPPPGGTGYPPPPGGTGYPPPPQPVQQVPGTNVMAIVALVCAFVFAPLGIVFGHLAKRQIKQTGEQGEGLANVGLILSYVFTGLAVVGCCIGLIAIIASADNAGY
jgi:hypothetical protein